MPLGYGLILIRLSSPPWSLTFYFFFVLFSFFFSCSALFFFSLGQQFATIEAITLMSMMVSHFTFEMVDPDMKPDYMASLTLPMAHGLPVYVKRRV